MNIDNLFVGIILTGVFVLLIGGVALEMTTTYNVPMNSNFTQAMNVINETYNLSVQMSNSISTFGNSSSSSSTTDLVIGGGYSVLKLAQNSIQIVIIMLNSFASTLGIPTFVLLGLITIVIILIVIAIVNAIFGRGLK